MKNINKKIFIFLLFLIVIPGIVFAVSSVNYQIEPLNTGNSGGVKSVSGNYNINEQQVGDTTIDVSQSVNYKINHGYLYPRGDVIINFIAIPEKRLPSVGNNSTRVSIDVYDVGEDQPLKSYAYYNTNNDGYYEGLVLEDVDPGVYDIAIKGYAHTQRRLSNITLVAGVNSVDFTFNGTDRLPCGDMYTNIDYPDGDSIVNSMDVTYLTSKWGIRDGGVSDERADVDENGIVNSLDIAKVVENYNILFD